MLRTDANTYDTFYLENSLSYLNENEKSEPTDKSVDGKPISNEIIKNSKLKGVIGKIGGIGADSNEPTRNGRRYPIELWRNVEKSEYFIEGMQNRTLIGEADHPQERLDYSVTEGAVVLTKYEIQNDGKVYTEFDILDTLPGRTVKTYFDAGCKLGVSSRGLGEEVMRDGEKIIDPDTYQFYCFDVVAFPAVKSARMDLIESTSPKKQQLINSITSEIKQCKSLDDVLFIESISQGVNLYLDEIKEAIEFKKEELNKEAFSISKCDNPEQAAKATEELLSELEQIGEVNRTDRDKKFIEFLRNLLNDYRNSIKNESIEDTNTEDTETKKLAKSIIDKIDKKDNKTSEDNQLSDFLKAWLGESNNNINVLFTRLKESMTDGYVGKNWEDVISKLEQDGYKVDAAYISQKPQNEEEIILYKDNKTFIANVNKYSDGGYEILTDTIKEENNNKIKITGPKISSDEDTPEVKNSAPDNNLEILAELQEEVNVKDSTISNLTIQLEQKNKVIQNLLKNSHRYETQLQEKINISKKLIANQKEHEQLEQNTISLEEKLQETLNQLNVITKRYENLQKTNKEFSKMLESLNDKYLIESKKCEEIQYKYNELEKSSLSLKNTNIQLKESLDSNNNVQAEVIRLNETIIHLTDENKRLEKQSESFNVINEKQQAQIKRLNIQNNELKNRCVHSLDKYIEAICLKYNLKQDTLRRLLGENYTVNEIDKVALELVDNMSKINSLPFANLVPDRHIFVENVGLQSTVDNESTEEMNTFNFMIKKVNS